MRILALSILAIAAVSAAAPAQAQTYNPNYPICMQAYVPFVYNDCSFTSIPQCQASASGRAAQCIVNPYFAGYREPPARYYRRHHRRYSY